MIGKQALCSMHDSGIITTTAVEAIMFSAAKYRAMLSPGVQA
jgi:hypothetical protein